MNAIINIKDLTKKYGMITALNNLSLIVNKGEMFGLVGPDGAGKTTTIRILCGLIGFDNGTVELMDKNVKKYSADIQKKIGYLSQKFSLYGDLSIDENIEFFAEIHNVTDYYARREELLEFTRLKPFRSRLADNLSGGMKQKLALAASLIHKPEILFLDEPTTGVDPVSRRDFWKILSGLLKEGITIFMTTPYLDEAERCNRVALMNKGEILAMDSPAEIKRKVGKQVVEIVVNNIKEIFDKLKVDYGFDVQMFGDKIHLVVNNPDEEEKKIRKTIQEMNRTIISSRIIAPSLENVFINLIKEAN
ncbi:MAG TPA: ABC transporter ATP-binding protein [Melioribacteraceae bacterium]|nr:ABC transporter ATP-binding protein [Melioribacteraceae bacterium]